VVDINNPESMSPRTDVWGEDWCRQGEERRSPSGSGPNSIEMVVANWQAQLRKVVA
jgi:hypothetical protein